MARFAIDASVLVEYILQTELGLRSAALLDGAYLIAPELIDAEVMSALRHMTLRGELNADRAESALNDLARLPFRRVRHREIIQHAWPYRHNVSAYDSLYVAVARIFDMPLVTADAALSRASGLDIDIRLIL